MLSIFRQLASGVAHLHSLGLIHRDVHPTRIHFNNGLCKFNLIGLPYNFKKLLKCTNYSGHVNYSAPEIISEELERNNYPTILAPGALFMARIVAGDNLVAFSPKDAINNDNGRPIFIVHGTADERINVHHTRELQALAEQTGANVTVTFALATVPIVGFVGAAVDYSHANQVRSAMLGTTVSARITAQLDMARA